MLSFYIVTRYTTIYYMLHTMSCDYWQCNTHEIGYLMYEIVSILLKYVSLYCNNNYKIILRYITL